MENLTLISCAYNTPQVTITMLKSFFKYHDATKVLIIDNSTNEETLHLLKQNRVPYISNPGGLHIQSIDKLFAQINTKYALLVDTDIIFLKNHSAIFESFEKSGIALLGDICGDRGGKKIHYRVHPWHCFIDVEAIKSKNIKFYNSQKQFSKSDKIYDVGCTFFSDIRENQLKIGDIKLEGLYFKHYEGMSWRTKRYGNSDGDIDHDAKAVHNNIQLYLAGRHIEQIYEKEVLTYKDIHINCYD